MSAEPRRVSEPADPSSSLTASWGRALATVLASLGLIAVAGCFGPRTDPTGVVAEPGPGPSTVVAEPAPGRSSVPPHYPQLAYSFEARSDADAPNGGPAFAGTPDDFYVVATGTIHSTVTRYLHGKAAWTTGVGFPGVGEISVVGDQILIHTENRAETSSVITRVDPDDGARVWSISSKRRIEFTVADDRLFVIEKGPYSGETDELVEYDLTTGNELRRTADHHFFARDGGFIAIDPHTLVARFVDLDAEPVGDTVTIEASGNPYFDFVVDRDVYGDDDLWIYYADRSPAGGDRVAVGRAPNGDTRFECTISIDDANRIWMRDENTLVISSYQAVEVFDVDGSSCSWRWKFRGDDQSYLEFATDFVVVATYGAVGTSDTEPATVEVLDYKRGDVVARGEWWAQFTADGQMITLDGDTIVNREIETGEEVWRLDVRPGSHFRNYGNMLIVTTSRADTTTVDVYAI